MDYIDGPSLAERRRARPLSSNQAVELVRTLAEAIQHAHEHGILHRDLKPSNILISSDGRPRVADFGLAKVLRDEPGVTRTGEVMGSPSYMAPEQAEGRSRQVDARTDVYALGVILYELLVGRPPFRAATSVETLKLMLESTAVSPRVLDPRLPRDLETICLKCLEKNPARRYASAKHLAEDLGRFLEDKPIMARPVNPVEKLWRWCCRKPLAAAYMYSGQADRYAETLAGVLTQLEDRPPETALDCLCVGAALVAGHPDNPPGSFWARTIRWCAQPTSTSAISRFDSVMQASGRRCSIGQPRRPAPSKPPRIPSGICSGLSISN